MEAHSLTHHHRSSQQLCACSVKVLAIFKRVFIVCQKRKKERKKNAITRWFKRVRVSLLGMSLFDLLQICEADWRLLLDMGTDTACPLWVTGYYRCFIVHDGKENCPFCCFFMATRKHVFIFQLYLVWPHTSQHQAGSTLQCDDCFVCLCKKCSPTSKKGHLQLFEWESAERREANQLQVQKGQHCKSWSNTNWTAWQNERKKREGERSILICVQDWQDG